MSETIAGARVLESLARRFPQLYVAPAEDAEDANRQARGKGKVPEGANLAHFSLTEADELRVVETPAGPIEVVYLHNRADFETFLQIMGHRSQPVPIARTVGAITYRGLADWGKVAQAYEEYRAAGGTDWPSEFSRLARQPGAFRVEIIAISEGPYSNIPAAYTPYDEATWLDVSREIRLHHECAHVVCRRTMPDDVLPVWDEITADVVGLMCATGAYDSALAALFLGVTADGYAQGRLREYLTPEQLERIDETAAEVYAALAQIEALSHEVDQARPFEFLLDLKRNPLIAY